MVDTRESSMTSTTLDGTVMSKTEMLVSKTPVYGMEVPLADTSWKYSGTLISCIPLGLKCVT